MFKSIFKETKQSPFLPRTVTIQQRGWHILNEVNTVPTCPRKGQNWFQRIKK